MRSSGHFRALSNGNFRLWLTGTTVSNLGTWLQRTAQDWLVLTQLTHQDAAAVGVVMALQFAPQLVLLPWIGMAADIYDRRKLLMITQALMGLLALILGILTISGWVALWQVYVFALLFGCVSAFDMPTRQSFVFDLVGERHLPNAIALNSTSFNASRLVGPAIAGILIAALGTGWAFVANGLSFLGVLMSLFFLRTQHIHVSERGMSDSGGLFGGFRYISADADLRTMMIMLALIGVFALNSAIFISTMAVGVFHADAATYGLLSSVMAMGSITGALLAAGRERPHFSLLHRAAFLLAGACLCAALAPAIWLFGAALVVMGIAILTIMNGSTSLTQLLTAPAMRGRTMALRLGVTLGGTAIGAPILGGVVNLFGPRAALIVAAVAVAVAGAIGVRHMRLKDKGANAG